MTNLTKRQRATVADAVAGRRAYDAFTALILSGALWPHLDAAARNRVVDAIAGAVGDEAKAVLRFRPGGRVWRQLAKAFEKGGGR